MRKKKSFGDGLEKGLNINAMEVPTVDDGSGNSDHVPNNVVAIGSCGGTGDNHNWCSNEMEEEDRKPSHDSCLKKEMALPVTVVADAVVGRITDGLAIKVSSDKDVS